MNQSDYYSYNPWWNDKKIPVGILRKKYLDILKKSINRRQIEILTGSRRVGKTTLLKQVINQLLAEKVHPETIFYFPLDFARAIGIPISDHLTAFRQIFSHSRDKRLYLFLD